MSPLTKRIEENGAHYLRWTKNERIQHWLLAASFILLVITGFALKYPESWWVRPFTGIEWLFDLRGLLHRIAGAVFIILGIYHVFYLAGTERGRHLWRAFIPRMRDLRHLSQNIAFNLGLRKQAPQFDHFSYMEKAEYFALIWGAVIMGVTGIMLWFEDLTLTFFARWVIDLVTVIHLYEAWLATLAIVVWHFYYVIFNPDVYPINTSMVDGKLSEKEMRDEYFQEWKRLQGDHSGEEASETEEVEREPEEKPEDADPTERS